MKQEEIETRLFELLEQKAFEELTPPESEFVLRHMSREEFNFQRSLITASEKLVFPAAEPLPLPAQPRIVWYKRSIPLYQAVSGAAAIVLFVWVLRNPGTVSVSQNGGINNNGSTVTATQIIYDTVVREVPVFQTAIRYIHDTIRLIQYEFYADKPSRQIHAAREFDPVALTEQLLHSNTSSMKDDKTAALLTHTISSDRTGSR